MNGNSIVEKEVYQKASTNCVKDAKSNAQRIGFPVMIKASEGGGGKGIPIRLR